MATLEKNQRSSMSEEAFELINCFYDGVDIIVRQLAEQIAIKEGSHLSDGTVAIEVLHVRRAGCLVVDRLKSLLNEGQLPDEVAPLVSGVSNCLETK